LTLNARFSYFNVLLFFIYLKVLSMIELDVIVFITIIELNWICGYQHETVLLIKQFQVEILCGGFSVCIDIRIHYWFVSWNSNNHLHSNRVEWVILWRVARGLSHWTWSGPRHKEDLPCWWLDDKPLRPNSTEFRNHPLVKAARGSDVKCMHPDN